MAESWVEKQSGISAPKRAEFASPNLRESGGWVEAQSGVAAPERAKSFSERMAETTAVYGGELGISRSAYEVDYSSRSYDEGGNLPFQISGGGNSWSVSGGRVNNVYVNGASFTGRNLSLYIDVENKRIVSDNSGSSHYVPIGKVVDGVGEGYLTSNIMTTSGSGCQFFYWGI